MSRRYQRWRDDFQRPRSYREWLDERYLNPARAARARNPVAFTLILGLAVVVFIFVCSVPCLIFGRLLVRLVMGA